MKIHKLETGNFKLDGGATFGVVPKSIWNKVYPADNNNLCNFSMRCLLIESENRLILIDAGMGQKQSEKFLSYFYLNGHHTLENSLNAKGFTKSDITDVLLTHLHFDHCGGAVETDERGEQKLAFPNAVYWVSGPQWRWTRSPNQRERASYLEENYALLEKEDRLHLIEHEIEFVNNVRLRFFHGHTEGLIVPFIQYKDRTLVFTSDLLPTAAHIPISWVCGFDTRPLISMDEKNDFLREAIDQSYILAFQHDIYTECCTLKKTLKGIRMDTPFLFEELSTEWAGQIP